MPELAEVETPKSAGFVDRDYNHERKRKRIEGEEEEIKRLEAQQRGEESESIEEETSKTEETSTEDKETTLSGEEKSFKKRYGDLRRGQKNTPM